MSNEEIDSTVRLLFIGIILLVSGLSTTALFSDNIAFAQSESTEDTTDPGTGTTEDTTESTEIQTERMTTDYTEEERNTRESTKKSLEDTSTETTGTTGETGGTETTGTTGETGGTETTGTTGETGGSGTTTDTGTTDTGTTDTGTTDTGTTDAVIEEPVATQIQVYIDNIEDSSIGQMVYIKGNGAVESQKIDITIFAEGNEEIVQLGIYSTNSGEFSTIWIVGSDLGDGTFTIKASDPSSEAETTFTMTGTDFVTKKVASDISDKAETLAGGGGEVIIDDTTGDNKVGEGFLYDKQFKDKLNILEKLIAFVQGLVEDGLADFETQMGTMETQMYDADDALQIQIDSLAAQTLVVTEKSTLIMISSGQQSSFTITCPAGEIAQGGGIEKMTPQVNYVNIFANQMDGTNGWYFEASNTHSTDLQVKLYVYCLKLA